MDTPNLKAAYVMTAILGVAMAIVSAGGAFASEWLYRDNPLILAALRGQDLATLMVAVPLLVAGLVLERRGSLRGRVLWIAMLFYGLYGYLFYAVGVAFNVFFLLYVAICGLSGYALLFSVPRIDTARIDSTVTSRLARRVAIAYMLVVTAGLGVLWTGMSASYLFTRVVPGPIVSSGHPTGVVFAIDLIFIVPLMLLGAVRLIRRRPWGGFLATMLSITGSVYTLTLAVASIEVARAGVGTGGELPIWAFLTVFGALAAGLLLAGMRSEAVE